MEMGMQNVDGDRMDMNGDGLSVVFEDFLFWFGKSIFIVEKTDSIGSEFSKKLKFTQIKNSEPLKLQI